MKAYVKRKIKQFLGLSTLATAKLEDFRQFSQVEQRRLYLYYQELCASGKKLPNVADVGFRVFSQSDEDGILVYIFALIGTKHKTCVDIAFSEANWSNTANLICNLGWSGLLVCGSSFEAERSRQFFAKDSDTFLFPPDVVEKWVTAENINDLLKENNVEEDVDLLSLDIDGVDYWVWKALTVVRPRVVVVEFQNMWGAERAVTVPYTPDFNRMTGVHDFYGASLLAFVKLAKEKGYRLVASNKYGFNAFFVRNDIGLDVLPEIDPQKCFENKHACMIQQKRRSLVQECPWVDV